MVKITLRLINSFEFSNVFYLVVDVAQESTLQQVMEAARKEIQANGKYRPVRPKLEQYDTMRVYCYPGQDKDMNLTFNEKQGEHILVSSGKTVQELGWMDGIEVSFYIRAAYDQWKK